jgi:outer membrane immunogenic protein
MKKLMIASAMAFMAATPALAQDADAPASREKSQFEGVSIAALFGEDVLTIQENNAADSTRGIMYGGNISYDHQVGKVMIGVQGEVTSSQSSFKENDLLVPGDHFASEAGRDIYGGVRVGFAGRNTMFYVGGGYVNSQLTSIYTTSSTTTQQTENKGGFRVSLGGEYQKKKFFGRLEMRYQDLGDYTVFGSTTGFARTHVQLVAGVGVRF